MKTVTYDDAEWALVPRKLTPEWSERLSRRTTGMPGLGFPIAVLSGAIEELVRTAPSPSESSPFQLAVHRWVLRCFGPEIADDPVERNHRLVEEAIELAQSCGATADQCHRLVDYVFSRPPGETRQEVGGVMLTLAALCSAHDIDMHEAGTAELVRAWECMDKIRAKQITKPKYAALSDNDPVLTTAASVPREG